MPYVNLGNAPLIILIENRLRNFLLCLQFGHIMHKLLPRFVACGRNKVYHKVYTISAYNAKLEHS